MQQLPPTPPRMPMPAAPAQPAPLPIKQSEYFKFGFAVGRTKKAQSGAAAGFLHRLQAMRDQVQNGAQDASAGLGRGTALAGAHLGSVPRNLGYGAAAGAGIGGILGGLHGAVDADKDNVMGGGLIGALRGLTHGGLIGGGIGVGAGLGGAAASLASQDPMAQLLGVGAGAGLGGLAGYGLSKKIVPGKKK
jgi:hypothetical protein